MALEKGKLFMVNGERYRIIGDNPPKQFNSPNQTWCEIVDKDGTAHGKYHVLNECLIDEIK